MLPSASRPLILVGTLQGALLWWLWHASQHALWPATAPIMMGAILWVALAFPFAIYLAEGCNLSGRRRRLLLGGVAVLYALLGAYAGWMGMSLDVSEHTVTRPEEVAGFGQVLAALALGFILIPLVAAWDAKAHPVSRLKWNYQKLFELAWRNALLSASVVVLTGLFWMVLYAGAMLMNSLGLRFIHELIKEPIFVFPVTGMVVGAVFAQGHAHADMLVNLRRYWLVLNAWLLPLLLIFGVMWVVALPFTGLDPLFKTRQAAFILLWFAALAVKFLNAAWQDGHEAAPYPRWLAWMVQLAWLALIAVVGVAGLALAMRIGQYGWSEDRVWAGFIWLIAAGHVLGYSLALLPTLKSRGWMATVGQTNIVVALVALVCLALLAGPVADPRRLAVNDQVARLKSGHIKPEAFDYHYLRFKSGRWGRLALKELSEAKGDTRVQAIAGRARQMLAQKTYYGEFKQKSVAVLSREEARSRIRVLQVDGGEPAVLDASLLDFLRHPRIDRSRKCLQPDQTCAIWLHDFNNDGRNEALLLVSSHEGSWTQALLLTQQAQGWIYVTEINGHISLKEWIAAIEQGKAKAVQANWNDIMVNGKRLSFSVPSRE